MRRFLSIYIFVFLLAACAGGGGKEEARQEEDRQAMEYLQGVWLDDNTELPVLKVKGDSIYLASQVNEPFCFSIVGDSLVAKGSGQVAYRVCKLEEHTFQFYTSVGDLVSLHKAESDTLSFGFQEKPAVVNEVIQKDSVLLFQGKRYRGYSYINPSTRKVIRPGMSEEGMIVDNVYYDNVIHICVYQGKEKLYARDITKDMFAGTVPDDFLQNAILSDMDFVGVDAQGYHYCATVCIPDGMSCYYVELLVDRDGTLTYKLHQ